MTDASTTPTQLARDLIGQLVREHGDMKTFAPHQKAAVAQASATIALVDRVQWLGECCQQVADQLDMALQTFKARQ